jgi:flagellar motility protein MotE (MotC chaperone)
MKALSRPIVIVLLGLLLGVGVGLGTVWTASKALVRDLRAQQEERSRPVRPERPWDFWTVEIEALAAELKAQREKLQARSLALDERESRLGAERKELEKVRDQVEALRREIDQRVTEVSAEESRNLKVLSATYRSLSPAAAVGIFAEMDQRTVVKLLSMMKPSETAAIFEEMGRSSDPAIVRRAASLSESLRLLNATRAGSSPN